VWVKLCSVAAALKGLVGSVRESLEAAVVDWRHRCTCLGCQVDEARRKVTVVSKIFVQAMAMSCPVATARRLAAHHED